MKLDRDSIDEIEKIRSMQIIGLALLIIIGVVDYMERATLSIGNTVICGELSLSKTQMGVLLSASL